MYNADMYPRLQETLELYKDYVALSSTKSLLDWDQQVYMPVQGVEFRSLQMGVLSRLSHDILMGEPLQKSLDLVKNNADLSPDEMKIVHHLTKIISKAKKIPASFQEKKTVLCSRAHAAWDEARSKNEFHLFAPYLEEMFQICREDADYLGYTDNCYDALLDQYEEGMTSADCYKLFETIKKPLTEMIHLLPKDLPEGIDRVYGKGNTQDVLKTHKEILEDIGFDLKKGRLDTATHPFCSDISPSDVRLTTRVIDYIYSSYSSMLHEAGHGMYEQNIDEKWNGTPIAGGVSLGFHESQSRFWENVIGRSAGFWKKYYSKVQSSYPMLEAVPLEKWLRYTNIAKPTSIRVESDELTYNLHVLIRFEIEIAVLNHEIKVKDIPGAWNEKMKNYLGIVPKSDREGCLQDVHWSVGSIGYFPTYTVGNVLCYQIFEKMKNDIDHIQDYLDSANYRPIFHWLCKNIYQFGKYYKPKELIQKVCGEDLNPKYFLKAMEQKYLNV